METSIDIELQKISTSVNRHNNDIEETKKSLENLNDKVTANSQQKFLPIEQGITEM